MTIPCSECDSIAAKRAVFALQLFQKNKYNHLIFRKINFGTPKILVEQKSNVIQLELLDFGQFKGIYKNF